MGKLVIATIVIYIFVVIAFFIERRLGFDKPTAFLLALMIRPLVLLSVIGVWRPFLIDFVLLVIYDYYLLIRADKDILVYIIPFMPASFILVDPDYISAIRDMVFHYYMALGLSILIALFLFMRDSPAYVKAILVVGALGIGYDWREFTSISRAIMHPYFDLVYFGLTLKPYTPIVSVLVLKHLDMIKVSKSWLIILSILLLLANVADYASSIHLVSAIIARLAAIPATAWYIIGLGSSTLKY